MTSPNRSGTFPPRRWSGCTTRPRADNADSRGSNNGDGDASIAGSAVRINRVDAVMEELRVLIPSELPAVVFTSLAALCVPVFSDRCHIFVEEDGLATYRIERPLTGTPAIGGHHHRQNRVRDAWSGQWVSDHTVETSFTETPNAMWAGYRGTVVHLWKPDYLPTGTDFALAQLIVDHAVDVLRREQGRPAAP